MKMDHVPGFGTGENAAAVHETSSLTLEMLI